MSHKLGLLSNSQRLLVCCTLVVTLEVTYLGTQLKFWYVVFWRFLPAVLNLSIMSYQDGPLSNSQRLGVLVTVCLVTTLWLVGRMLV